jgi:Mitochondrial carrier protein
MGGANVQDYPIQYFAASALAATGCYPLWRSAAIGQSGFRVAATVGGLAVPPAFAPYVYGFLPPYKGMMATVLGMTYARATIFFGSDYGRELLLQKGYSVSTATVAPPLVLGTIVQIINQPIVRATVTLQNPAYHFPNVWQSMVHIYSEHGVAGLWHGTTAGVFKTVPKYCTAIVVKDFMEEALAPCDPSSPTIEQDRLVRSALKSGAAGVAGAALTNPLDVLRNEQFKTHLGLRVTLKSLIQELGWVGFITRGLGKNMIAVALPVGCTIFFTEAMIQWSQQQQHDHEVGGSSGGGSGTTARRLWGSSVTSTTSNTPLHKERD